MFLGGTTWAFRWIPPYESAIDQISELGFKGVELTIWSDEAMQYYSDSKVTELKQRIADKGMMLTGIFLGMSGTASAQPENRELFIEQFKQAVDIGNRLGSPKMIICGPTPFEMQFPKEMGRPNMETFELDVPTGMDFNQNYSDFIASIRKVADVCETMDHRLAFEPHPHRYMKNADSMLRILEHVGSDRVGMNIDPSHLYPMGEMPDQVVHRMRGHIFGVHVSDNDGLTNAHWRPGKGKIDWNAFFRALKAVGYDENITIELEDVPGAAGLPSSPAEPVDPLAKNPDSDPVLIAREYNLSAEYLRQVCKEEGITLL
ncbi:sugar phosphate isomerase/epimerase family protein [Ruminococcus gauvreauii]|uniref:Sugar phosphate isomerase/epimerase n=1 Tax=Ruminococcus gauvreauii TaxID=438033 RepID=A0ABY5VG78_9FIRM|nr:sugar phosphate isomerase/epimerase [Ruminococcus gauvreauii]UWP59372.1 sugar phosphate isomerase/epimerase [Ruminococcus gauvreauii]